MDGTQLRTGRVDIPVPAALGAGPARLAGTLHLPWGTPMAAVVLNGATGVPARYYAAFARWLAEERGLACLTFDYRDFAASGAPRRSGARMVDWGVTDAEAARHWLGQRFPDLDLWVIGHSLGAIGLPFQTGLERVSRIVAVAGGPLRLSDHPWPYRAAAAAFWYGHGPVLAATLGYLPGRASGLGADLPGPVYWQWRRWCLSPRGSRDDATMPPMRGARFTGEARFVVVDDDPVVPAAAVWRLMAMFPEARLRQQVIRPAAHGLPPVGHIAAFAPRNRALWPQLLP
jgi:predicted alpha/beta hydrolase